MKLLLNINPHPWCDIDIWPDGQKFMTQERPSFKCLQVIVQRNGPNFFQLNFQYVSIQWRMDFEEIQQKQNRSFWNVVLYVSKLWNSKPKFSDIIICTIFGHHFHYHYYYNCQFLYNQPNFYRSLQVPPKTLQRRSFRDYWCNIFYRLDVLSVAQPTASNHWLQWHHAERYII